MSLNAYRRHGPPNQSQVHLAASGFANGEGDVHNLGGAFAVLGVLAEVCLEEADRLTLARRDPLALLPENQPVGEQVMCLHFRDITHRLAFISVELGPCRFLAFLGQDPSASTLIN